MANQSANSSGPALAEVPAIRSFEFDSKSIGNVQTSVNQFRGIASVPIDFITLPGRPGLDVKISAIYGSNVRKTVGTWNVDAPTGVLGLGWDMPFEQIVVAKGQSDSSVAASYYLLSNGSGNPLLKTGQTAGGQWIFQARNYQFWSILYDPSSESWTIIKENGFVYTYGGKTSAAGVVQWGVRWGNWIGSTARMDAQANSVVGWNLASIQSLAGDRIAYEYLNVAPSVGAAGGLQYTQAAYIRKIHDSYGRTVTFNYGQKYGALNPSSKGIVEYQAANAAKPAPNAFQDRYETSYLDNIEIANADSDLLFRLQFTYDFVNSAPSSNPNSPLFYKRVLTSVWRQSPTGATLPSMDFAYYATAGDLNFGALWSITYPQGAVAGFTYKELVINAPKSAPVNNPLPGSLPGVWHGDDYVVLTFCIPSGGLKVLVYSFNGRWVSADVTAPGMNTLKADPKSVAVATQGNYFAVFLRNAGASRDQLYVYSKKKTDYGQWNLQPIAAQGFPLKSATAVPSQIAAGSDFITVYNPDYTQGAFQGFSYTWQSDNWAASALLPSPSGIQGATGVSIAGYDHYYIVFIYRASNLQGTFQILYRDLTGGWHLSGPWTNGNMDVVSENGVLLFNWSLAPTFAVGTYVTSSTANTINYSLRLFDWDQNFLCFDANSPTVVNMQTPVTGSTPKYSVFSTIVSGSFVANNYVNLRNVGGTPGNNNWQQQAFNPPGSFANPQFASGPDVAIMSAGQNQLLVFDPNLSITGGFSFPSTIPQGATGPTVSGNYYTIGSYIYNRNPQAQWNALPVGLIGLGLPESVQNRGPNYIAYQSSGGNTAQTYVVTLSNGSGSNPVALPGPQKIYVPQAQRGGTTLAGPRFLVSYPSSQSFDSATNLTLYTVDEGSVLDQVTDYPIAFVEVTDAYDPSNSYCSSFFYANSSGSQISYNPLTGLAQYPLVFTVPGVKSASPLPPSVQPQGRTENHYSNGLSPQSLPSPASSSYNYDLILNGFLLMQVQFDSTGTAVASQINNWSVERQNALSGNLLYGGYVRMVQGITSKDGVQQTSSSTYDPTSGLQTRAEVSWYDSNGSLKRLRTDTSYAYQAYGGAFLSQHLLTPVAQQTKSVIDSGGAIIYVQSDVTTYKNWGGSSNGYWDASEYYRWTTPGATAPSFDFSGAGNPGWLRTSAILKRYMPSGMVQEQSDVTGARHSFIYDKLVRYQTASFPNASLDGNEASYCGFEDYETGQGWSLGAGAAAIPNTTYTETDAHTGFRSIRLDPTPAGQYGIQNSFTPLEQSRQYVFSAWVKTPDGFNIAQGQASWTIQFSANGPVGQPLNVDFPDETGKWVFLSASFALPTASGPVTVELRAVNANTSSYVLIDDVSFSPLDSIFTEQVFNTYYWLVNAGLGPNGECTRTVYGQFEETVARTNVADQAWSESATYFSRKGNQGKFSPNDPNQTFSIQYAGGGNVFNFAAGSEWQSVWHPGIGDVWSVTDGRALTGSGTLTLAGNPSSSYGLRMRFAPLEPITQPLGINCGGSVSVVWEPSAGQWQLLVNGKPVASVSPATQFSLPAQQFAGALNAPRLATDLQQVFAQHGYVVSQTASLTALPSGSAHVLTVPGRGPILYLRATNNSIDISQAPGDWILTVTSRTLLFYAGGQRIFSYVSASDLVGAPQLFFNNRVAIAGLVSGADPQIAVTFSDSRGNARQAQSLIGQQAVVSQSFIDNMGRVAVSTKSAYMDPTGSYPLMAYRPDFASYDWSTNTLTGYVNGAYPKDGGYPYTRQVYETSALSRVIERGIPGSDFAVGAHSTKFLYGTNDTSSGLPANQYLLSTTIDPNGDQTWQLATTLQQTVMKVSIQQTPGGTQEIKNFTVFNDYGFAVEMRAPNYYNPPPNSSPNDWVTQQSFDYAGRVIQSISTGKNGARLATNYIFDNAGNIRFMQDPQGAHDGNYTYFKYDVLGRPVETGYIAGSWDPTVLQQRASGDPSWPPTPPTWRKQFHYDGTGADNSRGRVSRTQANNGTAGVADVIEAFEYDISGNRINAAQTVLAGQPYTFQYGYDNLGNIVQIVYPATLGIPALSLTYQYNQLNQVSAIADAQNPSLPIATFAYEPNGRPTSQILDPQGGQPVATHFGFNSPLWIGSIGYATKNQSALLVETLGYTNGGRNGVAYYNGQVASEAIQSAGVQTGNYTLQYAYDSIGAVAGADCVQKPDFAIGSVAYDANGNFTTFQQGTQKRAYTYFNGTQQVSKVADTGNGQVYASYDYDLNGNAVSATLAATGWSDAHQLVFTYDPALKLTQTVNDSAGAQWNLSFTYGAYNQRVLKTSRNAAENATKLYLFGTSSYPLVEIINDSKSGASVTRYVFGPGGLIAMDRCGQRFRVLRDHLGSTRMILDANAAVVAEYDYLSFGSVAAKAEPAQGFMPYLYSGQEFDWEVGLYNYRARFYDSNLGRFLSADPKHQYFSPYIYASNNPVLFIDPTGRFSIGSFFSAIAGAIIGAVEILIGVVVDIIAGVLEVVTGGLSTPASIALASLAGAFYGAGSSALLYSAFHFADFDWRSYGIEMGIGAVTGAISFGFGAAGGAAAEAATGVKAAVEAGIEVSQAAKAANSAIQAAFNITGGAVADAVGTTLGDVAYGTTPGADVAQAFYWGVISGFANALVPSIDYKAGWGELGKRVVAGVGSSIAVGVPLTVAQNLATGNKWDEGLLNTVAGGAVWGTIGSLQVGDATKAALDFKFDFEITL